MASLLAMLVEGVARTTPLLPGWLPELHWPRAPREEPRRSQYARMSHAGSMETPISSRSSGTAKARRSSARTADMYAGSTRYPWVWIDHGPDRARPLLITRESSLTSFKSSLREAVVGI